MNIKQSWSWRCLRFAGCAALLALLAASSYAGARRLEVPDVPIVIETISAQAVSAQSVERIEERLLSERTRALSLLESVLEDPSADETARRRALEEKTKIAVCMETEAAVGALLHSMGFSDTSVIMGEKALSIIAPWQIAENERNRVRMIDAAVSASSFSAESVKIILAKNEREDCAAEENLLY